MRKNVGDAPAFLFKIHAVKKWFFSLLMLCSLFSTPSAWSAGIAIDCTYTGLYIFMPPATINVGRDVQNGDLIGSWISTSDIPTWTCYRMGTNYGVIRLGVAGYGPYVRAGSGSMTLDGKVFGIYTSAVKAGLGYIVRWRTRYQGETSEWQALNYNAGLWQPPETLFGPIEYDNQTRFSLDVEVQIHFVKTGELTAGNVGAFDPIYLQPYRSLSGGSQIDSGPYRIANHKVNDLRILSGGTCTTPNVSVQLPAVPLSAFAGVGSFAGVTPFDLDFRNCPAGLKSIGYSFAPTTTVVIPAQGVFSLNASSTATGIGLQMTRSDDTPITFGNVYLLENYDFLNPANYTIPLKVRMYQTSNTVTAGTVNSAVTFTMNYK